MPTRKQKLNGPMLTRRAQVGPEVIDVEDRTARLSFSSEEPYTQRSYFREPWVETLGHGSDEADFSRLQAKAPLLFNHDGFSRENHIGIVERAWIENGRGIAEVRFSKVAEVEPVWERVVEGTLSNVSVGYEIHERELTREVDDGPNEYRVTRWSPMEVSIVTVPADASVGVGRSADAFFDVDDIEVIKMSTENPATGDGGEITETPVAEAVRTAIHNPAPVDVVKLKADAVASERSRITDIHKAVRMAKLDPDFADVLIDAGKSVDEARAAILEKWAEQGGPPANQNHHDGTRATVTEDAGDKFSKGAESWLLARAGMDKHDAQNEYNGYSLRELLRTSLEVRGHATRGMGPEQMLTRAGMHGMSDFPEIVRNVANKALLDGYQEAPTTYSQWTVPGSLSDFKTAYRVDFGGFDNLAVTPRGSEVQYVTTGDGAETIGLATYANKFSIDRQTIIDDDVSAFSRIPQRFGEAAAGTANEIAYGILTANAAMSDGVAIFHASHGNLLSALAITTASVDAMRVAMATQKRRGVDSAGRPMNVQLKKLVVPVAIEGAALTLQQSQYEITASSRANTTPNSQRGRFEVIADAYLDSDSATAWYGMDSRETVELAFLNGVSTPTLMRIENTNILGVEWLVYIDIGASALNHRTMAKNPGA